MKNSECGATTRLFRRDTKGKGCDIGYVLATGSCEKPIAWKHAPSQPLMRSLLSRNSADAVGYSCPGAASKECSDCGIQVCEDHAEPCGTCFSIFCPPCRFLHRAQHSNPAHGERRERKRA